MSTLPLNFTGKGSEKMGKRGAASPRTTEGGETRRGKQGKKEKTASPNARRANKILVSKHLYGLSSTRESDGGKKLEGKHEPRKGFRIIKRKGKR